VWGGASAPQAELPLGLERRRKDRGYRFARHLPGENGSGRQKPGGAEKKLRSTCRPPTMTLG